MYMTGQESFFSSDEYNQYPTLSPETLILWGLSSEEQENAYQRWIDRTTPGRVTLTMEQSNENYHADGNVSEWQDKMKNALKDYMDAYDYADRKKQGQLTESEIANHEAFRTIFPNRTPFQNPKQH